MRFIVFRNPRLDFTVVYDQTPAHIVAGCKKKQIVVDVGILDEQEYNGLDDLFNKRVAPRLHPNTARALRHSVKKRKQH